jgi:hypothetical protein
MPSGKGDVMKGLQAAFQDEPLEATVAIDVPAQSVRMGDGYDSAKFEIVPSPLEREELKTSRVAIDHYEQNFHFLRTSREVLENLEAGASGSAMVLGVEVSATAKFVRSLNLTQGSVVLAGKAYYDVYEEVLETLPEQRALHPAARKILHEQGVSDFLDDYGSYHVNRMRMGGRLQIVLQWNFSTSSEAAAFKATLEARYEGSHGAADFQSTFKKVFTQEGGTLQVNKVGGGADVPRPPVKPDDAYIQRLFDYLQQFPVQVKKSPALVSARGMGTWKIQEIMDSRPARDEIYTTVNRAHAAVEGLTRGVEVLECQLGDLERIRSRVDPDKPEEGRQAAGLVKEVQETVRSIRQAWTESKLTTVPNLRELKQSGRIARMPDDVAEEVGRMAPIADRLIAGDTVFMSFADGKWLAPPTVKGPVVYPGATAASSHAAVRLEPVGKSGSELLRHGDIVRLALVHPHPEFSSRTHLAQQWAIYALVSADAENKEAFWFKVHKVDTRANAYVCASDAIQLVLQSHKEAIGPKKDEAGLVGFGDNTTTKILYLKLASTN